MNNGNFPFHQTFYAPIMGVKESKINMIGTKVIRQQIDHSNQNRHRDLLLLEVMPLNISHKALADVKGGKHTCLIQEHGSVAGRAAGVAKVERGEDLLAPDDHNEAEDNGNTQHEPVVAAGLVAQQVWRGKEGSKLTKMDNL